MLTRILFVALASACSFVSAGSAASQFHLNVHKNPSTCFLKCHQATIAAVHNADDDPLGNNEAISGNCEDEAYITNIPTCLMAICESAPDVAYAVEFGRAWCAKAGVDVKETLVLPEFYTEGPAKEYFQSEAYLSSASLSFHPSMLAAGVAITLGPVLAFVL